MAGTRAVLAFVVSAAVTVASGLPGEDPDCMTTLIDLADIRPSNRNVTVDAFHRHELDQKIIYDMSRLSEFQDLLRSVGITNVRDNLQLFKCLNKEYRESGGACFRSSPCGQGVCAFDGGQYVCHCDPGYTGNKCKRELNECDLHHPCLNGGTCHDHVNNFTCSCLEGFYGRRCETDRNECASSPCRHGSCIDVINGFQCDCEAGYTGKVCDEDLDECTSFPCQHGTCQDHLNKYACDCQAGYKGYNCDVDIDECSSQPCQNQATCHDKVNNFTCKCSLGYDGRICDNEWLTKDVITEQTKLRASMSALQDKISSSGVITSYTRWGRTVCPDPVTLVYSGYVAGTHYQESGGGSNPLCLHSSPRYARYADHQWGSVLYGAVYKMQGQNQPYSSTHDSKLVPCVVCAASQKTTTIMIPARNDCPADWRLEYHGYLLSSHTSNDKKSQHLCFDDAIEGLPPTGTGYHHLYRVGIVPDRGLPNVFPMAREVTCAVCSK